MIFKLSSSSLKRRKGVDPRQKGYNQMGDTYFAEILDVINN